MCYTQKRCLSSNITESSTDWNKTLNIFKNKMPVLIRMQLHLNVHLLRPFHQPLHLVPVFFTFTCHPAAVLDEIFSKWNQMGTLFLWDTLNCLQITEFWIQLTSVMWFHMEKYECIDLLLHVMSVSPGLLRSKNHEKVNRIKSHQRKLEGCNKDAHILMSSTIPERHFISAYVSCMIIQHFCFSFFWKIQI